MARIARKTKRYPSDLTDEEWDRIAPLMPKPGRRGRPREVEFREVINAVRYLVRSGCGWRMLPIHFGHWRTVYGWFRELARRFLFQTIHDIELMFDRERQGREASPSAAVIDSQSIKAPHAKTRGYDAGKKIVGRKRHIAVDTDGRLLMVNLTTADISDSAGAVQSNTDFSTPGWGGPCPPAGSGIHHYDFCLYALKVDKLDLPANCIRYCFCTVADAAALKQRFAKVRRKGELSEVVPLPDTAG